MNAAEQFVKCLESEGVRYIFGVPGEENEALLFALEHSSIRFIPCRHEQGAAFIANVWGRLTGCAGVCLATLGPGATNLVTGIADANLDKAPVVAITAQGSMDRLHHESHQLLDVMNMFRPITKWNGSITAPEVVTEICRKAFKEAEYEKPGATHIELPEDIADMEMKALPTIDRRRVRRPGPDYKAINATLEQLKKAQKPLIIAGNGAIRKLASKHLTRFVKRLNIPVVSTFMGKGAVSDKADQSLHTMGLGFKDYVLEAVEQADLILTVGYDVAEYPPKNWNPTGDKPVIHIDFTPSEVYTHYHPVNEVVGDISGALWELNRQLSNDDLNFNDWYTPVRDRIREDLDSYTPDENDPFTVPSVLTQIRNILPDDGLLLSDVGTHKMWIARNYPTYEPNGCIISNGLASMGISLPGAIAAKLIDPDRKVIAAMGDGGFLMNAQELETARRLGVGFVTLVFNDNDYGLISWKQIQSRQRSVSTEIGNPDFTAFAESFGIRGYRPENWDDFNSTLKNALDHNELCLIEVPIDTSVNQELVEKLKTYWEQ